MIFLLINLSLILFFAFLIFLGVRLKIWAFIPVNTVGCIVAAASIGFDKIGWLDKVWIGVLGSALFFIFIVDVIVTLRDLGTYAEDEDLKEIHYLTSANIFEHYKIIGDERIMKAELDKQYELPLNDRLQALETWKQGNRAYLKKHYQEAIEKYDLSNNWVKTVVSNINQSGVLIRLKQYENAIGLVEQALTHNDASFEALMNYGVLEQNLKRYDEALAKFELAVNSKPESFEAWFCCGNIQLKLKEYKKAIECYNQSIRKNNEYSEAWFNKGVALKSIGEDDQALKCFDQVIKLNPVHYQAFYRRGNILNEMDYNDDAIASYDRAVKIYPEYVEAWNNRGIVLRKIGKLKEAIKSYDRAIKCNPKYHEAWINRGLAQDSLGKYKQAVMSYQRFLEFAPADKEKYVKITRKRIAEIQEKYKSRQKPLKKRTSESGNRQNETLVPEQRPTEVS
ncbi:tetratricopeptide repeat protein [candidate division KSB1 bacterium]|nr:tetratricopeptide repeat protein [candidate division KSB1 bacterium]